MNKICCVNNKNACNSFRWNISMREMLLMYSIPDKSIYALSYINAWGKSVRSVSPLFSPKMILHFDMVYCARDYWSSHSFTCWKITPSKKRKAYWIVGECHFALILPINKSQQLGWCSVLENKNSTVSYHIYPLKKMKDKLWIAYIWTFPAPSQGSSSLLQASHQNSQKNGKEKKMGNSQRHN